MDPISITTAVAVIVESEIVVGIHTVRVQDVTAAAAEAVVTGTMIGMDAPTTDLVEVVLLATAVTWTLIVIEVDDVLERESTAETETGIAETGRESEGGPSTTVDHRATVAAEVGVLSVNLQNSVGLPGEIETEIATKNVGSPV